MNTNNTWKTIGWWIFALIFTLVIAYYQRLTGPTHPYKSKINIDNIEYKYKFSRSGTTGFFENIHIDIQDTAVKGIVKWRRFKSFDSVCVLNMHRESNMLIASLPSQQKAGKIIYEVSLIKNNKEYLLTPEPLIIRFKGNVPPWILIPHVIFMFLAMWFSSRAGIEAIRNGLQIKWISFATLLFLILGGAILGPIVQKYAFDAYWTGWPFGHDLTDNKTLLALMVWIFAIIKTWRNPKHRTWVIIASIILLAVYLIPHSVLGSEIDYTKLKP